MKTGLEEGSVTTHISGAQLEGLSNEAESIISDVVRVDVVANYASLTASGREILGNLASNMIAQKAVLQCKDEYAGQSEMELVLDVIENDIRRGLSLIKEDKVKTYLGVT